MVWLDIPHITPHCCRAKSVVQLCRAELILISPGKCTLLSNKTSAKIDVGRPVFFVTVPEGQLAAHAIANEKNPCDTARQHLNTSLHCKYEHHLDGTACRFQGLANWLAVTAICARHHVRRAAPLFERPLWQRGWKRRRQQQ